MPSIIKKYIYKYDAIIVRRISARFNEYTDISYPIPGIPPAGVESSEKRIRLKYGEIKWVREIIVNIEIMK